MVSAIALLMVPKKVPKIAPGLEGTGVAKGCVQVLEIGSACDSISSCKISSQTRQFKNVFSYNAFLVFFS